MEAIQAAQDVSFTTTVSWALVPGLIDVYIS